MDSVKASSYLICHLCSQAADLISLGQPVSSLVQAGQVFAVQQFHGGRRYGKISRQGGQSYLHVLREQALPPGAVTLQVREAGPPVLHWPAEGGRGSDGGGEGAHQAPLLSWHREMKGYTQISHSSVCCANLYTLIA